MTVHVYCAYREFTGTFKKSNRTLILIVMLQILLPITAKSIQQRETVMTENEFQFNEEDYIKKAVITLPSIPDDVLQSLSLQDNQTGLFYRIDKAKQGARTQRLIHIWRKNRGIGVSWNVEDARQGKVNFNDNFKHLNAAKDLAARMLKTDPALNFDLLTRPLYTRSPHRRLLNLLLLEVIIEILLSPDDAPRITVDFSNL